MDVNNSMFKQFNETSIYSPDVFACKQELSAIKQLLANMSMKQDTMCSSCGTKMVTNSGDAEEKSKQGERLDDVGDDDRQDTEVFNSDEIQDEDIDGNNDDIEATRSSIKRRRSEKNISKEIGTRIKSYESQYGPLERFSNGGVWMFKMREDYSREVIDTKWSHILNGRRFCVAISAPIVLPSCLKCLIGNFGFYSYYHNSIKVYFKCHNIPHNNFLEKVFPLKFVLKIKMEDEGFQVIKVCEFQINQIGDNSSEDIIPINTNWNRNKQPSLINMSLI